MKALVQKHNREGVRHSPEARAKSAKRFTAIEAFRIFCIWMRTGRDTAETARVAKVSYNSVRTLVNNGRENIGIKPFADIAEDLNPYARTILFPEPIEEFIRALWEFEWAEEKIVKTVLLTTSVMQSTAAEQFVKGSEVVSDPHKTLALAEKTLDVLEKCANIEERYMKRAKKLGMKFGDGSGGTQEDLSNLTAEELRRRIAEEKRATRVVEAKAVEEEK